MNIRSISALAMASVLGLSACGGGDGSSSAPPSLPTSPAPTNSGPRFSGASAAVSVPENTPGVIAALAASDADGDALTYTLGGVDAAAFTLSAAGELQFVEAPDFDLPRDGGMDNVYDVIVSASDGKASAQLAVAVTVTNLAEGVALRRAASGIDRPVGLDLGPDGSVIVAQADGRVWRIDGQSGRRVLEAELPLEAGTELIDIAYGRGDPRDSRPGVVAMTRSARGIGLLRLSGEGRAVRQLLASGAPEGAGGAIAFGRGGLLYAAVGDPDGMRAQGESGYGRSFVPTDHNGGDLTARFAIAKAGYGVRQPGGMAGMGEGWMLLADQAGTGEHEIDRIASQSAARTAAMPNFGWPFYAGTVMQKDGAPAGLSAPQLVYAAGDGPRQGEGVVLGGVYAGENASLRDKFIFGDRNGAIWAVPEAALRSGALSRMDTIEDRSEDFAPDQGTLDGIVEIKTDSRGHVYILDRDGELFVLG